jgi:hypothetical protein
LPFVHPGRKPLLLLYARHIFSSSSSKTPFLVKFKQSQLIKTCAQLNERGV